MTVELRPADFTGFFRAIHKFDPFPWQQSLVEQLAHSDTWPDVLELPTGSGKTAALDAAVFHLALCANSPRRAALRIVFVVDRRLVVDDAHARAEKIAQALRLSIARDISGGSVVVEVARRLQELAGKNGPPLIAQRLRGGAPLEHDWARTPTQPTILCSTVDQVGSRLLFRGYGVSDRMKPVHAGLLGVDSLILLDEAHLSEPFQQTLSGIREIGRARFEVTRLSATPGNRAENPLALSAEDRTNSTLRRRLEARKHAVLKRPVRRLAAAQAFAAEARAMAARLRKQGISPAAVGIVVNRVTLARTIFDALKGDGAANAVLMIGRSRGVDRDRIVDALAPFRTGEENRRHAKPLFVVATQCLEVGVDLDLDGLVTQAASLDALRQRFGRLNRAGRPFSAEGAIIALAEDITTRADDPVYGDRIHHTWNGLQAIAKGSTVDFGVEALPERLRNADIDPDTLAAERPNAPVLMPAYLDLWSHTSPRPTADPEVGLFLHGPERAASGVSIVWRGDISEADLTDELGVELKEIVRLVPPRSTESVELPLWVVRAWLNGDEVTSLDMSDSPEREAGGTVRTQATRRRAFRWAGYDDPNTGIINGKDLRVGDLLVIPAAYGGCDEFGWAPDFDRSVMDVADVAAKPYWERRCAVRIARDIVPKDRWHRISSMLAAEDAAAVDVVNQLFAVLSSDMAEQNEGTEPMHRDVREPLQALRRAKGRVKLHFPYAGGAAGGAVLVAEQGIDEPTNTWPTIATTEDEASSHTSSAPVSLDNHGCRVARFAEEFARTLGLDEDLVSDLRLAAYLHDAGKADPRFQVMLAGGDPWNRPDDRPLAKSGRSWSPQAWDRAELPKGWRHEALSVRMAREHPRFAEAHSPDLVIWLIGTHHGLGRPFFEFYDPAPEQELPSCLEVAVWRVPPSQPGPQSLKFDLNGADWPSLYEELKQRYGIWGLANLEAILRLSDHRASEEETVS